MNPRKFFKITIIVQIITTVLICSDSKQPSDEKDLLYRTELEASKREILSNKKETYNLENAFKSKEIAVEKFLLEVPSISSIHEMKSFITWDENLKVIFPNTYGYQTSLDFTSLKDYQKILTVRGDLAIEGLKSELPSSFTIKRIEWESPRIYGKIIGHKPKSVTLVSQNKEIKISSIKMVFEVNHRFKVGVIAP